MIRIPEFKATNKNPGAIESLAMYLLAMFYIVYAGLLFRKIPGYVGSILFTAGLGAIPVFLAYFSGYSLKKVFCLRRPRLKEIAGGLFMSGGLFLIVLLVSGFLIIVFPGIANNESGLQEFMTKSNIFVAVFCIAVLPAVCEELLFRGYILSGLKGSSGKYAAIILCGCLFGFLHLVPFQIPFTAIIGIGLSYAAWETRSILVPIIMHFCHNLVLLLIARDVAAQATVKPEDALKTIHELFVKGSLYSTAFLIGVLLFSAAMFAMAVFFLYSGTRLMKTGQFPEVPESIEVSEK